ncbi:Replication protein P [Phocoenobacter uteri]|uniref:Replication protein P n=1 Tax=Phocoenobacter uteri TaxID=146806 RepID=A0A379C9P1_9PAST|nr:replication protein P [Phocoenobacter uteri]MDG6880965.1 hypothetical protein [Phocoenobacter uteri]SUB58981.1 Replication protein P [Phocoenobacter uteri]
MKTFNSLDLATLQTASMPVENHQPKNVASPEMAVATKVLFNELRGAFPAWRNAFKTKDEYNNFRKVWLETLLEENITPEQLQAGLRQAKLSESPFFPSVGMFIKWCREQGYSNYGLPSEDELLNRIQSFMAFGMYEVNRFKFKSDAEYWLITDLYCKNKSKGWTELQLKKEIKLALKKMAEKMERGEAIPEPQTTLPKKEKPPMPRERSLEWIRSIRKGLKK